jgi:hypothetical protein
MCQLAAKLDRDACAVWGALRSCGGGEQSLAALKLLAKKCQITKDWEVPFLQVADGSARTASLIESVQREDMHPADQFEAFAALVSKTENTKLTFACPANLKADLDRYAFLHAQTFGETML